ncbi:MAG: hypothetical protein HN352_15465 [Bacteroidetes bacterium]|jgi:hypothetical protein|nr:hypothetical protein [Bacteroidota bacterium]MBT3747425.1 hypothetical protein [Bacteroidota bacterium]MBT4401331.1 hypothetical protein [Bacteroidota bacterium]MBT4408983.1 hypothetical protein [Bacteroidota bacterium]MBT5425224.1 hypothetical protein [Bacteroidota bacterium]
MKHIILIFTSLLCLSIPILAQEKLIDPLGKQYNFSSQEIQKLDEQGNISYRFSKPQMGKISWLDLSDPFRILLYFSELNQILFLDSKLSDIGQAVNLDELNLLNPAGIANSKNGGIWVLDQSTQSLVLLNNHLSVDFTIPVRVFDKLPDARWFPMQEWKQNLYLLNPGSALYVFDLYGRLFHKISINARAIRSTAKGLMIVYSDQKARYIQNTNELDSLIKKP